MEVVFFSRDKKVYLFINVLLFSQFEKPKLSYI